MILQWYAGIRPPYWCRNKTLSEGPILPYRVKIWLFLTFKALFRRFYLWNILLRSNVVRAYCNYIYKIILGYFTFILDLELMILEKGDSAGIRPLSWQNRRLGGSYSGVSLKFRFSFFPLMIESKDIRVSTKVYPVNGSELNFESYLLAEPIGRQISDECSCSRRGAYRDDQYIILLLCNHSIDLSWSFAQKFENRTVKYL